MHTSRNARRCAPLLLLAALLAACTSSPSDNDERPGSTNSTSESTPTRPGSQEATMPEDPASVPDGASESTDTGGASAHGGPSVVVTFAGWNPASESVEVSAYVPVVESDGQCALELTADAGMATATTIAYADASSTSCDLLVVPGTQLSRGTWQAQVSYTSATTTATSSSQPIEIP